MVGHTQTRHYGKTHYSGLRAPKGQLLAVEQLWAVNMHNNTHSEKCMAFNLAAT